ncbi:MAG: hypothetical protein E7603_04015 [Ruminococcaceae bacterium]|nr:hypothetical protein [Oscillospiraceae bacterium]
MKKKSKLLVKFSLLAAILVIMIYMIALQVQISVLQQERDELLEITDNYKTSISDMEHELLLPKEEYIAKYAREILGFYKYSDIIFKQKNE